jgi:predicted DNA-binding WGR domain protein
VFSPAPTALGVPTKALQPQNPRFRCTTVCCGVLTIDGPRCGTGELEGRQPDLPARNEGRFYRLEVWPDLFGHALLARQWGRIGSAARLRLDPHSDPGAAINALARLVRAKRRRGYRDRAA